ncbi:MAG: hypothetical protein IT438_03575 [Phycisphaerales bacterium]|nr:hypothetical protein [Phycisphaerales bacterium]
MPTILPLALIAFALVTAVLSTLATAAAHERRMIALREQALALRASYAKRLAAIRGHGILEVSPIDDDTPSA